MRFLLGVVIAWTIGRAAALVIEEQAAAPPPSPARPAVPAPHRVSAGLPLAFLTAVPDRGGPGMPKRRLATPFRLTPYPHPEAGPRLDGGKSVLQASFTPISQVPATTRTYSQPAGIEPATLAAAPRTSGRRLSGSIWAFVRGGGRASALSPVGQIGGGQAGARLLYRLDQRGAFSLAGRLSGTIGGARQTEAAIGLDWKPLPFLPVHLMADRRIAIDKGGRNAWTLGAAGGIDDARIAPGWRLDGYGEAGVVGARRRDPYGDGAVRIARAIDLGEGRSLALGGGTWAAAQPRAARIDIGPSAVLRVPVDGRTIAIALDWRQRVAGHAKPGSGVALTVAADF